MHLKLETEHPIHLSHFMNLVSAWNPSTERVQELAEQIIEAQELAKKTLESRIVSQDSNQFFFVVYPSGSIALCCEMRVYKVVQEYKHAPN